MIRLGFHSQPKPWGKLKDSALVEGFLSVWGFNGEQRQFVVANGGCGWWRKILECWKWFWKKERGRNGIFPKVLRLQGSKRTSEQCSRKRKHCTHSRHLLKDPNGQIMDKCSVKRQTKFWEEPTVNKGGEAFLPRQLHVSSLRSFIKRLPREASSWLLWEAFSRGFFEKQTL